MWGCGPVRKGLSRICTVGVSTVFGGEQRLSGQVDAVNVEISVVLGRSTLPMHQLLRMGRGAVIPLDARTNDEVWILANNHPVARGEIQINEDKICIAVTRAADVYDFMAGG
jgi:flagellar motor switch protein FliN/FliY